MRGILIDTVILGGIGYIIFNFKGLVGGIVTGTIYQVYRQVKG